MSESEGAVRVVAEGRVERHRCVGREGCEMSGEVQPGTSGGFVEGVGKEEVGVVGGGEGGGEEEDVVEDVAEES